MELMKRSQQFLTILRCPISGAPLYASDAPDPTYWCKKNSGERIEFPSVGGQPVLIDFEKSIAKQADIVSKGGASLVEGRTAKRSALKRFIYGYNRVEIDNARRLMELTLENAANRRPRMLVVGGGTITPGVRCIEESAEFDIITFDIYASANTDFIADAHAIPLASGSIDAVWIQAVLEHVLSPEQVVAEIERVLATDGLVYSETPFLQPVHEKAYDFTRFTESGHRWLFRRFALLESGVVNGPGTTTFQILRYFVGAVLRNRKLGSIVTLPFFWLRFLDLVIPRDHASDIASGVFFLGRKSAKEILANEMPAVFQGVE